jgi:hypothetical protein
VLDPRLTARAVQNLVRNAMRYCDESLLLRLRLEDDGACLLTVEDDGIGIPAEERERIFQPFYRLDRSRDRNTGGFGAGDQPASHRGAGRDLDGGAVGAGRGAVQDSLAGGVIAHHVPVLARVPAAYNAWSALISARLRVRPAPPAPGRC